MLAPFGKFIRKFRIDRGTNLKEMANMLGVTSSYLSAVELGRKAIPSTWALFIATAYNMSDSERLELIDSMIHNNKLFNIKKINKLDADFLDKIGNDYLK